MPFGLRRDQLVPIALGVGVLGWLLLSRRSEAAPAGELPVGAPAPPVGTPAPGAGSTAAEPAFQRWQQAVLRNEPNTDALRDEFYRIVRVRPLGKRTEARTDIGGPTVYAIHGFPAPTARYSTYPPGTGGGNAASFLIGGRGGQTASPIEVLFETALLGGWSFVRNPSAPGGPGLRLPDGTLVPYEGLEKNEGWVQTKFLRP